MARHGTEVKHDLEDEYIFRPRIRLHPAGDANGVCLPFALASGHESERLACPAVTTR